MNVILFKDISLDSQAYVGILDIAYFSLPKFLEIHHCAFTTIYNRVG